MRTHQTTIRCDSCNTILREPTFYKNDGSFQDPFTTIGGKDLCFTCMGKMFSQYIRFNKIPDDEIVKLMESLKPLNSRGRVNVPFDFSELKLPKSLDELKKYTEDLKKPKFFSSEAIKKASSQLWDKVNSNASK